MKKLIAFASLLLLAGCISMPKPPEVKYHIHETVKQSPQTVVDDIGTKYQVFNATEHTYDVNYDNTPKPLGIWQKFCNWLAGLSILGLCGLVAGFVFAPAATVTFLLRRYWAFKKALTQTVHAIDEAKAVESSAELKAALSANHDNDTKQLIDDIKRA